VILFDGVCNFCNGAINLVLKQDRHDQFRFAPLQSVAGQQLLRQHQLPVNDFESFVLVMDGKIYQKSTAALKVMRRLPWVWQPLQLFWIVPRPLRDAVYAFVARNRYRWFGKKESCMIPTPQMRARFLD
jgi:predicted DCC family thiol-disulfide oxidoreductase YuxK